MNILKRIVSFSALLALILGNAPVFAATFADESMSREFDSLFSGRNALFQLTTESRASIAMRVKWTGDSDDYTTAPTVTVAAGGDMTFNIDAAVDPEIGYTTEVTVLGIIDLSTPAAGVDTYGELEDIINATDTWECLLVDAMRSDLTNNTLYTRAETTTGLEDAEGLPLYFDQAIATNTAEDFVFSLSIGPEWMPVEYFGGTALTERIMDPTDSSATTYRAQLNSIDANGTLASGASYVEVWFVHGATEVLVYSDVGSATTVAYSEDFKGTSSDPIIAPAGWKIVVRYCSDTAGFSAGNMQINGKIWGSN